MQAGKPTVRPKKSRVIAGAHSARELLQEKGLAWRIRGSDANVSSTQYKGVRVVGRQAFERSLPYQFKQLLNEIDAIATHGGQGIVLWRRFTPIATLSMREASRLTSRKVSTIKRAFGALHRNSAQVARWD